MDHELLVDFLNLGLMFLAVMGPVVLVVHKLKRRSAANARTEDGTLYANAYDYDPRLIDSRRAVDRDDRDTGGDVGGDSGSDARRGD